MFSVLRVIFVILCFQHSMALLQHLKVEPHNHDDVHILADFLKFYITKFRHGNRRLVSLKHSADTSEQAHKQADIIRTLLEYTKDLPFSYSIINMKKKSNQLGAYLSLNIVMVDSGFIFR